MTTSAPTRPKLSLKPSERAKAIEKGILGGLRTAQIGPGAANATAGTLGTTQAAANAPAARKPTLVQEVCAAFGVEWLKYPLAIGIGNGQPPAIRRRIGLLVRRPKYLHALVASPHRFNADGSISGEVSEGDRESARAALAQINKQQETKK